MKFIAILLLYFMTGIAHAQKYVLVDKTMSMPLSLTNTVTIKDEYRNLFAIEKSRVPEFLVAINKIEKQLTSKTIPASFKFLCR